MAAIPPAATRARLSPRNHTRRLSARRVRSAPRVPSQIHELLVSILTNDPSIIVALARSAGLELPDDTAVRCVSVSIPNPIPDLRSDGLAAFERGGRAVLALPVEVQLRVDPQKWRSWPRYSTEAHWHYGVPVALLVVTPYENVAAWARRGCSLGYSIPEFRPLVIGPEAVPVIASEDEARRRPGLATLSALAHSDNERVVRAALGAIGELPDEERVVYCEAIMGKVDAAMKATLSKELIEKWEFEPWFLEMLFARDLRERYEAGLAEGVAEGEGRGRAAVLLRLLAARFGEVLPEIGERVHRASADEIDRWAVRVLDARSLEDVFG